MKRVTVQVPVIRKIPEVLLNADLAYFGLDHASRPLALFVSGNPEFRDKSGMFVKTELDEEHDYHILHYHDDVPATITIYSRRENFHFVQPTAAGGYILVGARCNYRDGDPEKNALVVDQDGRPASQFTLGDGIKDVQVSASDDIWCSYFDEGVYGNYGWSQPLGAAGLNRWSIAGELKYSYHTTDGSDHIDDCYALNVSGEDVWFCYYSSFPLVRLRGHISRTWRTDGYGSSSIAVLLDRVAFLGSYQHRDHLYLCKLNDDRCVSESEYSLRLESGESVAGHYSAARNSCLAFHSDGMISMIDIANLPS